MGMVIDIVDEPRGDVYRELLAYARRRGGLLTLAWRDNLCRDETDIAARLRSTMVAEARVSDWPGTRLLDHAATLRTYQISDSSIHVLGEVSGLYGWEAPARPEDLAFYDTAGRNWLGSIAHERNAFVDADVVDPSELAHAVPGLHFRSARS